MGPRETAMSGLWGLEKKTSYRSGQRKTFTMWCNMKLVTAGCNTMSVDNMKDEMKNGVVLVTMLEHLTGKTVRGINRNPKHNMTIMANLQACWKFMEEEEGIDMGGVNVTNFTTSWKDGDAFLALLDSIVPGIVDIEAEKANDDPNERVDKLQKAFNLIEEHLGVAQLVEPQDLMVHRIDHKCVMCYVAAIKKASAHYDERKAEMEAAEKNENLMHKLNADKLYEEGMSKKLTAQTDSQDALSDITASAQSKLDDNEDDYEMIEEQANDDLNEVTSRFDQAISKFEAAKDEYGLVADSDQSENIQNCDDRIRECTEFIENLKLDLEKKLKDMIADSKAKKKIEEGDEMVTDVMAETGKSVSMSATGQGSASS